MCSDCEEEKKKQLLAHSVDMTQSREGHLVVHGIIFYI